MHGAARLWLLGVGALLIEARAVAVARSRRTYSRDKLDQLHRDRASEFSFGRFQAPTAVKAAFDSCRSRKAFKSYTGKDGRTGFVCSTQLGGDWVLAESEQVAPSCTCEQVIAAYLDGELSKRWNADKIKDVTLSSQRPLGRDACYRMDLKIHSQRIIRSHTGVMRYGQRVTVDKVGRDGYCASVVLDPEQVSTARKPFNTLSVYVGLQQAGADVRIYAAGVMEVNRRVVPNLVVFDASGIAGDQAGKGTLWLAGHFEERRKRAASAALLPWSHRWRARWERQRGL